MWVRSYHNQSRKSSNIEERYSNFERPLFVLILSNTEVADVPGISGAGSSQARLQFTPAADAEIITCGALKTIEILPDSPSGAATPAVLSRAALNLTKIPCLLINSGLKVTPGVPYYDMRAENGRDIQTGLAVKDSQHIYTSSKKLAKFLDCSLAIIGESIPGGTTTALAVLRALGYGSSVSSSFSKNPIELKEQVVKNALTRSPITSNRLKRDPIKAVELFGDPMMPCAVGLVEGLTRAGKSVMLAGGTQMGAVIAILRALNVPGDITLGTTKYIFEDTSASFINLVKKLQVDAFGAYPDFRRSKFHQLKAYELGEVKEGVGAGGAMAAAAMKGFSQEEFRNEAERVLMGL
jgi:uncharacterized protein (TIGR00303 family)